MKTAVLAGVCGLLILFGAVAAVNAVIAVRSGFASLGWPEAPGDILRAERRSGVKNLKKFEYSYSVDGRQYTSTRAAFVRVPYLNPLHRTYSAGQRVAVRYDPADPAEAVLEPGAPSLAILAEAVVPVLLVGFGAAGLYYGAARRGGG